MKSPSQQISTCPNCGGVIEQTPGGEPGCMFCLLQAGIRSEEETAQDSTPAPVEGAARFGVYEIDCHADGNLCELGRGAMGVTYRATDTSLQRKVALKIIKTDAAERSADARERFVREARAAAALRHENIATVYQFGVRLETGQYFYAMELIEGETLDERVRRAGPLDARTTIGIAEQVTSALAAAEKQGLVHRDLKPANLMLVNPDDPEVMGSDQARSKRGRIRALRKSGIPVVRIIDFGLAKAFQSATDPTSLTHDKFVGTPAFASPEQIEHSALDVRSDIYSLGETLWFALTGKTPFTGRTLTEILRAQKSNVLPSEQLKVAHVPHRLKSLLESMLAFEPASRPGTSELAARLQRCSPEARSVRRTRAGLAAAFILILAATGFFAFRSLHTQSVGLNPSLAEKSIAVLPFENRSEEKANAYFADGVQDEILTDLAKVADLKVISRTSVMQYKNAATRNLREIAQQLGVAHVLEGSVQRSGNRVRVSAQLIDAKTDTHLWAERYDRDLADVFGIQSEIAKKIVDQLQAKISASEKAAIEEQPTKDLAAYDFYVRATPLIQEVPYGSSEEGCLRAVDLLNQAIIRDPNFLLAYCWLARAHDTLYFTYVDHTPTRLALANSAISSALGLKPDSGEAHLALALHLYFGYFDYDRARTELDIARRTLPNNKQIFKLAGMIDRRQGRWPEAVRNFERAFELDPRNFDTIRSIARTYEWLRIYQQESDALDRALALKPNDIDAMLDRARIAVAERADTRPLHAAIEKILADAPASAENQSLAGSRFWLALIERDFVAAGRALSALPEKDPFRSEFQFSRAYAEGLIARMKGDAATARDAFSAARAEQEKTVRARPDFGPVLCGLGLIDAKLGRKEEALREGRRAVELTPLAKQSFLGAEVLYHFAVICAWTGERDLAIEQLETLAKIPAGPSYGDLRLGPDWDPLRGDPRYEKIVASLARKDATH
jgi:serine/threonine protein kinase/Tfp pilus assembly protein PilF